MAVKGIAFGTWQGESDDVREHINDIRLDPNGQLLLAENTDADGNPTQEAYKQILIAVVRTLKGEILMDVNLGIDYENTVWTNAQRLATWERLVRKRVAALYFVAEVNSLETHIKNGTLYYSLTVTTDYGAEVTVTDNVAA